MSNPLLDDLAQQFRGRTVLVTGADGLMGSHLTEALVGGGAAVHAFVRATSGGRLRNIAHLRDKVIVHRGDLTDRQSVDLALRALKDTSSRPSVFHLGAQPNIGESWERPYQTIAVNVLGTLNLLQGVVDLGLDLASFVLAGSSTQFSANVQEGQASAGLEVAAGGVLSEGAPLRPQSIYGTTKAAAEFLVMNFYDAYGVPASVARMFNHYGPRQSPRYITGTIITQALLRSEVKLGSLEPKRDFCFSEDGVRAHLLIALRGSPGTVYCYGQGRSCSIGEWARMILQVGQKHGYWAHREIVADANRVRPSHSEVTGLAADFSRLQQDTGWEPRVSWEEGLHRTIRWYAEHQDSWKGLEDWK